MSDVSTTLIDPFILTPEEMDQLHLDDGPLVSVEDDSSQDIPGSSAQVTHTINPRDEEKRKKNREAAKRLREKGVKKQTDMRQDILDLSAKQCDLKYKAIQVAQEFLDLIKVAEEHRKSCNFQYVINLPTISREIAKLPGMSDLVRTMTEAHERYTSRHTPPPPSQFQREKRTHDDEQVKSDARTIKKLRKILQAQSSNKAPSTSASVVTSNTRQPPPMIQEDCMPAGPSSCITTSHGENPLANCPNVIPQGADDSLLLSVVKSYRPNRSSVSRPSKGRAYSTESSTSEATSIVGMSTNPPYQRASHSPYPTSASTSRSLPGESAANLSQNNLKVDIPAPSNHGIVPNWGVLGDTGVSTVHANHSHLPMGQSVLPDDSSRDEAVTRIKAELMSPMESLQQTPMSVLRTNVQHQPGSSRSYVLEPLQPTMNGQRLHTWNHPHSEAMFLQIQNPSTHFQFDNLGEMIANGMHAANGEDF